MKQKYYLLAFAGFALFSSKSAIAQVDGTTDTGRLDEVSVTATGLKTSTRKMGYTTSQVQGKALTQSGEGGVIQGLSGKASNVQITKNSGDPGAGAYIQIRGQNTITGSNQPLIILDGVPVSNSSVGQGVDGVVQQSRLNDINPADIENIEILKGAAAAAIWGTRAANGVIMITTKKGKKGLKVEFNSSIGFDYVNREYEKQGIYGQGSNGKWVANNGSSWGDKIASRAGGPDSTASSGAHFIGDQTGNTYYKILKKKSTQVYNDKNRNQVFRTGITFNNNISISSANEKSAVYFSASDWKQQGILAGQSDYHRTTGRLNFSYNADKNLKLVLNGTMSKISSNRVQQGSNVDGLYLGYLRTAPDFDNTDYSGTYVNASGAQFLGVQRGYRKYLGDGIPAYNNPGWTLNRQTNTSDVTRFILNPEVNYKYLSNSELTVRVGYDQSNDRRITYFPVGSAGNYSNGGFNDQYIQESELSFHAINRSDFDLTKKLKLNTTIGYLSSNQSFYNIGGNASQFIITDQNRFSFINSTSQNMDPFNYYSQTLNNRVYGIFDFDYLDKLNVQLTYASERSSTYANRFASPSASLSYEFSKDVKIPGMSFGKFRMSAGQVGIAPPVYIWNTNYVNASSVSGWGEYMDASQFGGSIYRSSTRGNPGITPEMKREMEAGFDLKFLKNKLSWGITAYSNTIDGAILPVAVAASTGYTSQWKNAANLSNKGIESELSYAIIRNNDMTWNIYSTYGMNRNMVNSLNGTTSITLNGFTGTDSRAIQGYAMGELYGGVWARDSSNKMVLDANGFPVASANSAPIGNPNPTWRGSMGTNFSWKGFTVNILFETCQGNKMWAGTAGILNHFGIAPETATEFTVSGDQASKIKDVTGATIADKATANADGSYTVRGSLHDFGAGNVWLNQAWYQSLGGGFGPVSEQFIKDASWTRLRELSINYDLPENICKMIHVPGASIGFTGRNLWLYTAFKGVDPETNLTGVSNGRGLDYFTNPGTKSFIFNIKVKI